MKFDCVPLDCTTSDRITLDCTIDVKNDLPLPKNDLPFGKNDLPFSKNDLPFVYFPYKKEQALF
jgi:hypothetical protein